MKILRSSIKQIVRPPLHRPDLSRTYDIFGSDYGGWPVIKGSLLANSRVLSFGVGKDVTFDLGLIAAVGCRVHAFDPTPRCREWLDRQSLPELFRFHPVGLSNRTDTLCFYAPNEDNHVSFTQSEARNENQMVELPVRSLREIVDDLEIDRVDFLKMDIEGSEYDAIPDILTRGPLPHQLCIEFHHGMFGYTNQQTREAVANLRAAGYRLYFVSSTGREYAFVRN